MRRPLRISLPLLLVLALAACGGPSIIQADSYHVTIEGTGDSVHQLATKHCGRHAKVPKYLGQSREDVSEFDCIPADPK